MPTAVILRIDNLEDPLSLTIWASAP